MWVWIFLSIISDSLQHLVRIERVTEAIADVVDRDDGDEDHQTRENRQPGVFDEVVLRRGDEVTPGRSRLLDGGIAKM